MKLISLFICGLLVCMSTCAMYKGKVIWPKDLHQDSTACINFLKEHGLMDAFAALRMRSLTRRITIIVTEDSITCRPASPALCNDATARRRKK